MPAAGDPRHAHQICLHRNGDRSCHLRLRERQIGSPATDPGAMRHRWCACRYGTDLRLSPLGPVWMKFSMRGDCSFSARLQMLFFRFTERGQYRASEGRIVFEREPGQTVWPYKLEGELLHLTEAPSEVYAYRRR